MVRFQGFGLPSFDFNGRNSLRDFSLKLTKKPDIPTPEEKVEVMEISGRDSSLTFSDGTYKNISIGVGIRLRIPQRFAQSKFEDITFWLLGHDSTDKELTFSHYPEWTFKVVQVSPYTWEYFPSTGEYYTSLTFECRPYKDKKDEEFTINSGGSLRYDNTRGFNSPLKIELVATSNTTQLSCNVSGSSGSTNMYFNLPNGYLNKVFVVDTDTFSIYEKGNPSISYSSYVRGRFPSCPKGKVISYTLSPALSSPSFVIDKRII
ncbi:tail protein [Bacillus phage PSYJ-YH]|nr:tail protein [Bacillus phage PSYJ-YH]